MSSAHAPELTASSPHDVVQAICFQMLLIIHEIELLMFLLMCVMDYIMKKVAYFDFPIGSVAK